MRLKTIHSITSLFKLLATLVVCLLLVSIVSRSFVVRTSERLQRVHSILQGSDTHSVEATDEPQESGKPAVYLVKRVRDDETFHSDFIALNTPTNLPLTYSPTQVFQFEWPESPAPLLSSLTLTLEKPPKPSI